LVLPDDLRTTYKSKLQAWYDSNHANELLHEMELNQLQRLIDYLDVVKTPHLGAAEQAVLQKDFKQFFTQYDQRRGKDFAQAFPNLIKWYNSI
jgi:hypothetical protein